MNVEQLIAELQLLPPDAEVETMNEDDEHSVECVYLTDTGTVRVN